MLGHVEVKLSSEYRVLSCLEAGELGLDPVKRQNVLGHVEDKLSSELLVLSCLEAGELGLDPVKRPKCAWPC